MPREKAVDAELARAAAAHRCGDRTQAEALYRQILRRNPSHAHALHLLGVCRAQAGAPEDAIGLIGRALTLEPHNADCHGNLGKALSACGRWGEAAAAYRRSLALDPTPAERWTELGVADAMTGRPATAAQAFQAALQRRPDQPRVLYWLGSALAHAGRLAAADAAFRRLEALAEAVSDAERALVAVAAMVRLTEPVPADPPADLELAPAADATAAPVYVIACDSGYFHRFARAVLRSVRAHAGPAIRLHIHVVDPDRAVAPSIASLETELGADRLAISMEQIDLSGPIRSLAWRRTYYACARFLELPRLLARYRAPILAGDSDQLTLKPLGPVLDRLAAAEADVGLFRVSANRLDFSSHILANAVFAAPTPAGRAFCARVAAYIRRALASAPADPWYLDQVALQACLLLEPRQPAPARIAFLPERFVNAEICTAPPILSGSDELVLWNLYASVPGQESALAGETFRRYI